MRRAVLPLLGPCYALVLLLFVFRPVMFRGEQFGFRDAAHFYYPLYLRVQQEWQAGRWPLWDPWQNGGQPLLGSPMAAVLYPGKLIYAPLPYAWAVPALCGRTHGPGLRRHGWRWRGHWASARSARASAALSYAFGAPVLFQHCNVIYLVGAAWVPWGLRALDRLLRLRRPWAIVELAVVLAMQVLGGDPQAAYLTVVCGVGYAAILSIRQPCPSPSTAWWLCAAWAWPGSSPWWPWLAGVPRSPVGSASVWVPRCWPGEGRSLGRLALPSPTGRRPRARLAGLAAGCWPCALAGAQLLPTVEFVGLASRTGDRIPTIRTRYSIEPYRLVELVWPWAFGHPLPENRSWIQVLPPRSDRERWEPSLYVGGLTIVLALGASGFRGGPPWRPWLSAIAAIGLFASLGRFGGPLWFLRWVPGLASTSGPHDPPFSVPRPDPYLLDASGSLYSLLEALLPGFALFRYPAKLFTFTAVAIAGLAGLGWDEAVTGRSRRLACVAMLGLVASAAALVPALVFRGQAVAYLSRPRLAPGRSRTDRRQRRLNETLRALAHGVFLYAIGLAIVRWGGHRPVRAGAVALVVLAVDLGLANHRLISTVPQAAFDVVPEVARRIAAAERADPSPGPFRIHTMASWHPTRFLEPGSPGRHAAPVRLGSQGARPLERPAARPRILLDQGRDRARRSFYLPGPPDPPGQPRRSPSLESPARSIDLLLPPSRLRPPGSGAT